MLKLCGFHLSNYHNKVRLALLEKDIPQVKPYLAMLKERPAFARVEADRKAAQELMLAKTLQGSGKK